MAKALNSTKTLHSKRTLIDRANSTVVIVTSVAAFLLIFCIVATKTLASQAAYQNRVIDAKRQTLNQLKSDLTAANQLSSSYQAFTSTPQNVLGGNPTGTGAQDGDNTKIVLDALPSTYDYPALITSLETLLKGQSVTLNSITGTDDEVAQSGSTSSTAPQPVAMPFELNVTGNYQAIQSLVSAFDRSIRPIQVQTLQLSGTQNALTLDVTAQSYYQPAKSLNISTKVVK